MRSKIYRVAGAVAGLLSVAPFASAVADTDGMLPAFSFVQLGANVASLFTQVSPVVYLVAGVSLALAFGAWVIATLRHAIRSRNK